MHEYTTDGFSRKKIVVVISIISFLIFFALFTIWEKLSSLLINNLGDKGYLPFIAIIGVSYSIVFGLIYFLFDNVIWKIKLFRYSYIGGQYDCTGKSYNATTGKLFKDWNARIIIKQTWSKISVILQTDESKSISVMARVFRHEDGNIILHYCYKNERSIIDKTANSHSGTTELIFSENTAEGKYYNYPDERSKYGSMKLTKEKKLNEF